MKNVIFSMAVISMTIDIYNNTSDNRYAIKDLTPIAQNITVLPYDQVNRDTPNFIIGNNPLAHNANYLYCDTFNRYYYIQNITLDIGGRMILHCKCDVLSSAISQLQNCNCTVVRSESIGRPSNVPDSELPIDPVSYDTLSQIFPVSIGSDHEFVLITIGGSTTP